MTTIVLASHSFAPLVLAQAKARKMEPRMAIFQHPIGGLSAAELEGRIDQAWNGLLEEMKKDQK